MPEIWDALPIAVLLALFLTSAPAQATGTTADCADSGDAPSGYYTAQCDPGGSWVCGEQGGHFVCDLTQISGCGNVGGNLTIVQNFGDASGMDFSAWGECNGATFCCIFDDDESPVGKVIANGTSSADNIHFDYGHDVPDVIFDDDLAPHAGVQLHAFMYGKGGNDTLEGSHFPDTGETALYRDNLYGDGGDDLMDGNHDGDWMAGGAGNDTMKGDQDNDTVVGGPGDDNMTGSDGNDYVCDDAYAGGTCASIGLHVLIGANGDDVLFYGWNTNCDDRILNVAASTAGVGGSDQCGDSDTVPGGWDQANEMPTQCETTAVTTVPSTCADPN